MNKRICLSAVLLVLPLITAVAQQQRPPLEPGTRVRITAPDIGMEKQEATFEALRGDTLLIMTDARMTCPLSSVTRIDRYQGRKSWGWGKGAFLGFLVGAGVGAAVGAGADCYEWGEDTCTGMGAAAGAVAFALVGGVTGALIKTDRWEEVPLDQLHVSLLPRRDGVALGFSVAF